MIREKIDASKERKIILYSIVSTPFLKGIIKHTRRELFKTPYAQTVWTWIASYFDEFGEAPRKDIQSIYIAHKVEIQDEEEEEAIASFLQSLSDSDETINNIDYEIKTAKKWIKRRQLENLVDSVKEALSRDDTEEGEEAVAGFTAVEQQEVRGVSLFKDVDIAINAFEDKEEILFTFPGAVGDTIGEFRRGDFVSFLGYAKRGKCASGDTQVLLSDGRVMALRDVIEKKEKRIVLLNEKYKLEPGQVVEFWKNGKKPVYIVRTKLGREVHITKNHPLFSFERGWLSIDEKLSVGMHIAAPKVIPFFGDKTIPDAHIRLLAYLLADGCLVTTSVTYTKKDPILMEDAQKAIIKMGDSFKRLDDITILISKGSMGPRPSNTREMLSQYGVLRKKSVDKEIPSIIFTLQKEQVRLFIKLLFSGDGSVYKDGIEYSSGSERMLRQVSHLLLRFGIIGSIRKKIVKGNPYWVYSIIDTEYVLKYINEIGFYGMKEEKQKEIKALFESKSIRSYHDIIPYSYKEELRGRLTSEQRSGLPANIRFPNVFTSNITTRHLAETNEVLQDERTRILLEADVLWDEIVSITYEGVQETYDLSVPKYHNFIADDICVHNTWWLWETAKEALYQSNKVLFISLEMPLPQIMRRVWRALSKKPKRTKTVRIPYFVAEEGGSSDFPMYKIDYEEKKIEGFIPDRAWFENWIKQYKLYFRGGDAKIVSMPSRSATVRDVETYVNNLEFYEGWRPDVIVIDYADLLSSKLKGEFRHQLDDIWANLRRLAIERNICIVTASQSGRASSKSDSTDETIAEDIRKIAHVTKMIAINSSKEEQAAGIYRIAQLAERDDTPQFMQSVVLSCLDLGQVCLDSRLKFEVIKENPV